ncbi:MAG: four helix bundle protein [Ignavibacteriaceae bacterium]
MNPKTEEMLQRTFDFGLDTLKFLMTLSKDKVFNILVFQLGKASTSLGSNYEEAQAAESSKDFNHKIGVVLKEIRKSNYWLRVLNKLIIELDDELKRLLKESFEFKKFFLLLK